MRGHDDASADKKMFGKMLKKAVTGKVSSHLKQDIKEQKMGIKKDKGLIKSIKGKRGC